MAEESNVNQETLFLEPLPYDPTYCIQYEMPDLETNNNNTYNNGLKFDTIEIPDLQQACTNEQIENAFLCTPLTNYGTTTTTDTTKPNFTNNETSTTTTKKRKNAEDFTECKNKRARLGEAETSRTLFLNLDELKQYSTIVEQPNAELIEPVCYPKHVLDVLYKQARFVYNNMKKQGIEEITLTAEIFGILACRRRGKYFCKSCHKKQCVCKK